MYQGKKGAKKDENENDSSERMGRGAGDSPARRGRSSKKTTRE